MSSYNHIVDAQGRFLDPDKFSGTVGSLGDAYEVAKEMYGMIWWLAAAFKENCIDLDVEDARCHSQQGIEIANRYINGNE
jgi:hypothetical protein